MKSLINQQFLYLITPLPHSHFNHSPIQTHNISRNWTIFEKENPKTKKKFEKLISNWLWLNTRQQAIIISLVSQPVSQLVSTRKRVSVHPIVCASTLYSSNTPYNTVTPKRMKIFKVFSQIIQFRSSQSTFTQKKSFFSLFCF